MAIVSNRWTDFNTSIFSVMTQKATAAGAINLAQGFPDFDGPDAIKEAAWSAMRDGHNQYAPAAGLPKLRQLLASRRAAQGYGQYDWDSEVTVYSGATEALFCALQALFSPGDEILAFEPLYDSYVAGAHSAGAKIIGLPLNPPSFTLDPQAMARALTKNTRALLLNSPHNPTGRVFTATELAAIRDFVVAHDLLCITDEVYDELVFAPSVFHSLASLPDMRERTVAIASTAKTFSLTGWKIGYAFAPASLTKLMRTVHQFTVFCSATPLQHGMVAALELGGDYYTEFRHDYLLRRDLLLRILGDAGFKPAKPEGTYFIVASYDNLSDLPDLDFASWLTDTVKVAAIPLSPFYTDQERARRELRYLRFAFCKGTVTLEAAGERLHNLDKLVIPAKV